MVSGRRLPNDWLNGVGAGIASHRPDFPPPDGESATPDRYQPGRAFSGADTAVKIRDAGCHATAIELNLLQLETILALFEHARAAPEPVGYTIVFLQNRLTRRWRCRDVPRSAHHAPLT